MFQDVPGGQSLPFVGHFCGDVLLQYGLYLLEGRLHQRKPSFSLQQHLAQPLEPRVQKKSQADHRGTHRAPQQKLLLVLLVHLRQIYCEQFRA